MRVGAVILTLNEEPTVVQCLAHLKPYVSYMLVLDGGSTDKTVELARKFADKVVVKKQVGLNIAELKNYAASLMPKWCDWLLFVDADERFDPLWLTTLKEGKDKVLLVNCFRFPRLDLPNPDTTYPDYQVRFVRNDPDYEWRNAPGSLTHETVYSKKEDKRLDQLPGVTTLDYCPILHLPRRTDLRRPWW